MEFKDLGLNPDILRAVAESGYVNPTPIQEQAIPHVLQGRDVLGIAQTGTGKTASFTLPMIDRLSIGRAKARMPRTLILEPTRELAAQVAENFEKYGKYHKLDMALLIGGVSFSDQEAKLTRGVDVLIATPGRLIDHFERGKLLLTGVQILVVDEADRMLDMGFIPDVEKICRLLPPSRQTLFFSATMPPEIQRLVAQFLKDPVRVEVARPATAAATVTQKLAMVSGGDWEKREALRRLIRSEDVQNAIIFCNRKRDVDVVAKSLQKHGFSAAPIHGDLDQSVRIATLDRFKSGEVKLLVASDVAARGLDIPLVGHVFNFDVPFQADDYVHRIGRTGRAGRSGVSITIGTAEDGKLIEAIEGLVGAPIGRIDVEGLDAPSAEEMESGRKARRGRGGRSAGRSKSGAKPAAKPAAKPDAAEAAKPAAEARSAPKSGSAAKRGGRSTGRRGDDLGPAPRAFGDHLPAFMLVEPLKKSRAEAAADDAAGDAAAGAEPAEAA